MADDKLPDVLWSNPPSDLLEAVEAAAKAKKAAKPKEDERKAKASALKNILEERTKKRGKSDPKYTQKGIFYFKEIDDEVKITYRTDWDYSLDPEVVKKMAELAAAQENARNNGTAVLKRTMAVEVLPDGKKR